MVVESGIQGDWFVIINMPGLITRDLIRSCHTEYALASKGWRKVIRTWLEVQTCLGKGGWLGNKKDNMVCTK